MFVWGVTGNNHDASIAVMEWRVQGLSDHYHMKLHWAGVSKDFSGIPGDPSLCPKMMAFVRSNAKWAFPAKIYFYEKLHNTINISLLIFMWRPSRNYYF